MVYYHCRVQFYEYLLESSSSNNIVCKSRRVFMHIVSVLPEVPNNRYLLHTCTAQLLIFREPVGCHR
jgi:hypothetical protein